jgi:hypothetical protein
LSTIFSSRKIDGIQQKRATFNLVDNILGSHPSLTQDIFLTGLRVHGMY